MRGHPLGQIIRQRIAYLQDRNCPYSLPVVIRDTMRDVEETARFRAPKFLAAYLDVLKYYLIETDRGELFPEGLRFELYLEFGVATQTLLSMIHLGLSRTSAVAINDYLASDVLTEEEVVARLLDRDWGSLDIPMIVKRDIQIALERRSLMAS
jgi:hypothetical protein